LYCAQCQRENVAESDVIRFNRHAWQEWDRGRL